VERSERARTRGVATGVAQQRSLPPTRPATTANRGGSDPLQAGQRFPPVLPSTASPRGSDPLQAGQRFRPVLPSCPHTPFQPLKTHRSCRSTAARRRRERARQSFSGGRTSTCAPHCTTTRETPIKGIGSHDCLGNEGFLAGPMPIRPSRAVGLSTARGVRPTPAAAPCARARRTASPARPRRAG
jgi:hypothetical protein